MRTSFQSIFTDNISYKIVAFFIAIVLWVTILGRRDFVLSRNIEIEFQVGMGRTVVSQSVEQIKVKVAGPRNSLRRFLDSGVNQLITIDLSKLSEGNHEIQVPINKIDVPFGVKIQSVKPSIIKVQIKKESST